MDKEMIDKFRNEVSQQETPEEIRTVCEKYGVDKLSEKERNEIFFDNSKKGELTDEELDKVSGGLCDRWGRLIVTSKYYCNFFRYEDIDLEWTKPYSLSREDKNCSGCRYSKWTGFFDLFICHK